MATPTLTQARNHYDRQRRLVASAVIALRSAVSRRRTLRQVASTVAAYQAASANTVAGWAGAQEALTVPDAFAGVSSLGFPVLEPIIAALDQIVPAPTEAVPEGWWAELLAEARTDTMRILEQIVAAEVADAGRTASQVEFVTRPDWQNYVRMLQPPSCPRCAILAGRIYRDLEAFQRHPNCDCVMVPVQGWEAAHDRGLVASFQQLFDAGNVRGLSKADAQAIRDGADPAQVVNATRGLRAPGVTAAYRAEVLGRRLKATTDGTTKRAAWRKANPTRLVRLRPEAIYQIVDEEYGGDPAEARRLLNVYGYLTDDALRLKPPTRSAGGHAGGGQPPKATSAPLPDPDDSDLPAWKARQDAIGLDFKGDVLKPWEVRSVERLVRRGEEIDWIPDDRSTATNDFRWLDQSGIEVEMKSTKARFETIRGRILDAASRAMRNHGVTKSRFIIDIGPESLTDDLRDALAGYNFDSHGRPLRKYRLDQLWVMSEDGTRLDEVTLRT